LHATQHSRPTLSCVDLYLVYPGHLPLIASSLPTTVALWIQPRASRDEVVGERDGAIAIRLQAPPVDGAANAALVRFIAARLGMAPRDVQLVRGLSGRRKWVTVAGLEAAVVRQRLLCV
jgi:uncharacterized protein (TIGR00251 family)